MDDELELEFIQPEFLHVLFFEQKNLVVFPYIDARQLHSLELFTVGYNTIDVDATSLNDVESVIKFEANNQFSRVPSFYFVHNLTAEKVKKILELEGVRCVLNTRESVSDLSHDDNFVFYNKKIGKFVNYDLNESELEFERIIMGESTSEAILLDQLQKIKAICTKIYIEFVRTEKIDAFPDILSDYDQKYWNKILDFVRNYFKIDLPKIDSNRQGQQPLSKHVLKGEEKDFSSEYRTILSTNKVLGKEFVQQLHEYRFRKVNPSNLDLDQLFEPLKLYNYLRNRHWKEGVHFGFLKDWVRACVSSRNSADDNRTDFETIFKVLRVPQEDIYALLDVNGIRDEDSEREECPDPTDAIKRKSKKLAQDNFPSVADFKEFKNWMLEKLNEIEREIERI